MKNSPVIVGGNGHSGTRIFAEILMGCGISMGAGRWSHDRYSKDLNIRGLMDQWVKPYLLGLDDAQLRRMERQFRRRLRLLIPRRSRPWGFKNPRAMFLVPFYRSLFPDMKFLHVIRDGRDMCFGNPFVETPTYWSFISEEEKASLSPQEAMMKFWGESNLRLRDYGTSTLGSRYLLVRFEDLCNNAESQTRRIIEFADGDTSHVKDLASRVKTPRSIGRWQSFDSAETEKALTIGSTYLAEFGYV